MRWAHEVLPHSTESLAGYRLVAAAVAALAPALFAVVLWRSHQDRRLCARLPDDRGSPISVHSASADVAVTGLLVLSTFFGLAGALFVRPGVRDGPLSYLVAAACVGLGLMALCIVPRRGLLVQVFTTGVRLVEHGRVHDLPWAGLRIDNVSDELSADVEAVEPDDAVHRRAAGEPDRPRPPAARGGQSVQ